VPYRRKKLTFAISSPDVFLLYFGPSHSFGIGKTRHFKCRVLIDTEEY